MPQVEPAGLGGTTIFLNRCVGGCTVLPGTDDPASNTSALVQSQKVLPEYTFMTGEWEAILACVKEVYSPFNVIVSDVRPTGGLLYSEILVGGSPQVIGQPAGVGGVAIVSSNCVANPKGVAFAFPSEIDVFAGEDGGSRVNGMCWVIAQETAHTYGLDHEYEWTDDTSSACNDPMTYRSECGGEKFFRNRFAHCGEFGPARPGCGITNACGATQNSHLMLSAVFGPGTSTIPPPTAAVTTPAANGPLGAVVIADAGSKRGVGKVELFLNGHKWGETKGAPFGPMGQPIPSQYSITVPAAVPNSIIDIVVRASDDLGIFTDSPMVTVTKGAACTTADSCAKGQKCENGRCFWDPPSGNIGDVCTYNEFCVSGICSGTASSQICTQDCIPGVADSCPADSGLECLETSPGKGVCFTKQAGGGCCSVGSESGGAVWVHGGLAAFVLGLLIRRRRAR